MPNSSDPIVPRNARRRSDSPVPTRVRPSPAALRQPIQPLAQPRVLPTQPRVSPPQSVTGRRWPLALRVVVWVGIVLLSTIAILGSLVLTGQTELVAWIIVGAVLTVVFGTPLLCVVGLFIFYVCAVTRMGRSRQRPQPAKAGGTQQVAQTIVVGEVVLDE